MTSDSNVQDLDITVQPIKPGNVCTLPPSPPLSQQHLPQPDVERKQEPTQGQSQPGSRTVTTGDMIHHGGNDSGMKKGGQKRAFPHTLVDHNDKESIAIWGILDAFCYLSCLPPCI